MVLDTDTYSCGYMISGGLAGGMMSVSEVLEEYGKGMPESLYHLVCLMANLAVIYLTVAFICLCTMHNGLCRRISVAKIKFGFSN